MRGGKEREAVSVTDVHWHFMLRCRTRQIPQLGLCSLHDRWPGVVGCMTVGALRDILCSTPWQ